MKEVEKQRITKVITQDFGISMHLRGGHFGTSRFKHFCNADVSNHSRKAQQKCCQHRTHHTLCH